MTDERRRELELIVELAIARMDLKITEEMGEVKRDVKSIPPMIDKRIAQYDEKQIARRRWTVRTMFGMITIIISAIGLAVVLWPGG